MKQFFHAILLFISCTIVMNFYAEPTQEKPLIVVSCMYNNAKWVTDMLNSIFMQNYKNFHVILTDDGSTDKTVDIIKSYIDRYGLHDKVSLFCNKKRRRKLANVYRALYQCDDNAIVIMIDGDDELAHENVFSLINKIYDNNAVWFTYGQYRNEPASEARRWGFSPAGYARPVPASIIEKHSYRKNSFYYMHLRTFKAWLFKLIKLEDLLTDTVKGYEGDFYPASNDLAIFYPIVEMAHHHIRFIPEIIYLRNLYSNIVGFKVDKAIQYHAAHEIKGKEQYPIIKKPIYRDLARYKKAKADLFIFCGASLKNLENQLHKVHDEPFIDTITVFCTDKSKMQIQGGALRKKFKRVQLVAITDKSDDFGQQFLEELKSRRNKHCLLTTGDCIVCPHKVNNLIYWLERTYAKAFFIGTDITIHLPRKKQLFTLIENNIYTAKFNILRHASESVHPLEMVLYKNNDLVTILERTTIDDVHELTAQIKRTLQLDGTIGLFYYAD